MNQHPLAGLEPSSVFQFFAEICAIPHGSRNTKPISDYLVQFAQARHLKVRQDKLNNVIIWKDGTPGYEDHPPVILQGHMDMVCEKDPDCTINFLTDGLALTHDSENVFARGTTLGGDDGIAVAYSLALLDATDIPHPPLEVIITVDEEIGMLGAADIDLSDLKGRIMVNLDSEDEGILTVSCAGGARSTLKLPVTRSMVSGPCVIVEVGGLKGGHSGVEIDKNRCNASKALGLLLQRITETMPICLTSLAGGSQDNAIPRFCRATFVAMRLELSEITRLAQALQEEIRSTYDEPDAVVTVSEADATGGLALSTELSKKAANLMCDLPNGILAWSQDIQGLVQTSLNLGIAKLLDDCLSLTFSVRSSVNDEKEALLAKLRRIAADYGCEYSQMGDYPAWEYKKDSTLRVLMVDIFREMFGREPEVVAIHAGLECGILSEKLPGLDCVSFGPQMHDIHTSREKLNIASTARMWQYLTEILKRL